jgi:hypothetical protein
MSEPTVYVLTKEYFDKSGFDIYGVTTDRGIAIAWEISGQDGAAGSHVYAAGLNGDPDEPLKKWGR